VHAETLQGVHESWKPIKVSEKEKLRRDSAFMHLLYLQRSQRPKELFEEFRVPKAQEEYHFYTRKRDLSCRAHRGNRTKVEAFWTLEILPSAGRKCIGSGGGTAAVRSDCERDLDRWFFMSREQQSKCTRRRVYGPSDLGPIICQPLDMTGLARELNPHTIEHRRRKSRKALAHRDIGVRDIGGPDNERSGHYKSRNSERIAAVDLRKDACRPIVHFKDPGTGTHRGERLLTSHPTKSQDLIWTVHPFGTCGGD
jgi:hypothetical protein